MGQVKLTTTNHTTGQSSSKEGDMYMVGQEGHLLLMSSWKTKQLIPTIAPRASLVAQMVKRLPEM